MADTGVGIPQDEQAQIFERFHRVNNGDHQPGSGIGLALVAEMTSAHGGSVEVASELGEGSRFVVRLPRFSGPPPEADLAEGAADRRPRTSRGGSATPPDHRRRT